MAKKKERRKFGDRKDGKLIRDLDPMHVITRFFTRTAAITRRIFPSGSIWHRFVLIWKRSMRTKKYFRILFSTSS